MVWGGISHGLKSQLVVIDGNLTAARYRDEILRPHVISFLQQHNLTLQQDNAKPHVARICQVFLANNNVQPLYWPPYSPDLSPIEHQLDRQARQRQPPPATRVQLTRALVEEWNNIPIRQINALMNSMTRRIWAVTRANGGHNQILRSNFNFEIPWVPSIRWLFRFFTSHRIKKNVRVPLKGYVASEVIFRFCARNDNNNKKKKKNVRKSND